MSHLTQMLGAHRPELRVRGDRHGGAGRADPRLHAPAARTASATSGSISSARRSTSCCRSRSSLALVLVVAGRSADLRGAARRCRCSSRRRTRRQRRHRAGDRARSGGVAGRDQAARHQRRRLLQRELRASAREPDAALQLPRGALDPADRGGALLHVRRAGEGPPPGLGALRRDVADLRAAAARLSRGRAGAAIPCFDALGVDQAASALQAGGNMEGKEVRFGIANSALWATATTAASNGSVNAMHDSFTPLGGLVPMWLIAVRRGRVRRRRLRPLRDAGVRDRRGLHRRPDGRPHARVPRQEDRGLRDEDGLARDPDPGGADPDRHRDRLHRAGRDGDARQSGRPRLQRDPLRVLVGRRQQRLARSAASR